MISIWVSAFALATVIYMLMRRTAVRTKLLAVAAIFAVPLLLTLWIMFVGDQMPEAAILVEPSPKVSP